ncbi:sensor histidine kinase [Actinomadura madurae]|uniref:sensor histidine kinase n=1 Tax=Actinomadura madurae TaxID=1993 RepID=UPI0020D20E97|nr:histidine kinase dimerization/phosphoacceptor domain-containing protein [Actinomadura madurae]MCP9977183.1 histidine kinase dimerization/phosphoacceptor domain-containing protein [Actinomadura madurae]
MLVRSRRQLIASLEERARAAETEQRLRVEEARLLERERIAREMHDVLAHRISLLAVHAGALEFRPDAPADQREAAGIIRQSAYEAMEDLREVIGVLRDDAARAPSPSGPSRHSATWPRSSRSRGAPGAASRWRRTSRSRGGSRPGSAGTPTGSSRRG